MNFKQFYFTEAPVFNNLDTESKTEDLEWNDLITNNHIGYIEPGKKFKHNGLLFGVWEKKDRNILKIKYIGFENNLIIPKNTVIFCGVHLNKKFNFPVVDYVEVRKDKRGSGIGYDFYEYLINLYGGIISDDSISKSAFNIYKKLQNKHNLYFIDNDNKIIHISKNLSEKDIGKFGQMFMVTKEKLDPLEWNKL